MWPTGRAATLLARPALRPGGDAEIRTSQLNATRGTSFDGAKLFRSRSTRHVTLLALAIGLILGTISVRARRLELASARHHGVRAMPQLAQLLVETSIWASAGAVCAAAITQVVLRVEAGAAVRAFAIRPMLAVAAGAVCGAGLGVAMGREHHLLRLFKER